MAIHYVTIKGHIKDGKLDAELPDNVVDGEAELLIPVAAAEVPSDTPIHFKGLTIGEMLAVGLIGTGTDDLKQIGDSAEWVDTMRRKEQEQRTQWKP